MASLIENCKLNGSEPHAYLSGALTAVAKEYKQMNINKLLPCNYAKPVRPAHQSHFIGGVSMQTLEGGRVRFSVERVST
ncbi:MAG: transposase domain-containing protein [Paracoccaceae bacterium]|nr:transposase domain-containing protein [Paracoccaceae bacterium]